MALNWVQQLQDKDKNAIPVLQWIYSFRKKKEKHYMKNSFTGHVTDLNWMVYS